MAYVYSTLTNDNLYTIYENTANDLKRPVASILIKGGTGVLNDRLITPIGVMTEVDDAELKLLESNKVFQEHKKAGFITVDDKKSDPEKVASGMETQDKSSPMTAAHVKTKRSKPEDVALASK